MTVEAGPNVPPEVATAITTRLAHAVAFVDGITGERADGFTMFIHADMEELLDRWLSRHGGNRATERARFERFAGRGLEDEMWLLLRPEHDLAADPEEQNTGLIELVAHEYVHVLQFRLQPGSDLPGPKWLLEGVADYIADLYTIAIPGHHTGLEWVLAQGRSAAVELDAALPTLESHDRFEAVTPVFTAYLLAGWASHQLAADGGADQLMSFYANHDVGPDWRGAFEATFGQSPDAFYDTIEDLRLQARAERAILGSNRRDNTTDPVTVQTSPTMTTVTWPLMDYPVQSLILSRAKRQIAAVLEVFADQDGYGTLRIVATLPLDGDQAKPDEVIRADYPEGRIDQLDFDKLRAQDVFDLADDPFLHSALQGDAAT